MIRPVPSQERLLSLLSLSDDGVLVWKVNRGNVKAGSVAGTLRYDGYIHVGVEGKQYYAHRLVWTMVYGGQPPDEIDHINSLKRDNRPCNLRTATKSENCRNRRQRFDNTSGVTGVSWNKKHGKWLVRVTLCGAVHFGGLFSSLDNAKARALQMRLELHGAFAADQGVQS